MGLRGWNTVDRAMSTHIASRLGEIVDLAARARPLKDAMKFMETTDQKLLLWTYADVKVRKRRDALRIKGVLKEAGGGKRRRTWRIWSWK